MSKDYRKETKTLLVDLEVSPNLMWGYGQYEVRPIKIEMPKRLLCIGWKWLGEKEIHSETIWDDKLPDPMDDTLIVKKLWELFDEANVVVSHNIAFDDRESNAFFLTRGMKPPSPYKTFCTLKTARKYFRLDNNKLDYLGGILGVGRKTETTYADVWYNLLEGNDKQKAKASKLMVTYNKQDIAVLEGIYNKLLPFAYNHPNMSLMAGKPDLCPRCGHSSNFKVKSYRRTGIRVNAVQYECLSCHSYVTRALTSEERDELKFYNKLAPTFRNQPA